MDREGDQQDPDATVYKVFMAGWKAKKKTGEVQKKLGFVRGAREVRTETSFDTKSTVDPRKAASKCAVCKQIGHWRGDTEFPKVKSGEAPMFEKKPVKKLHYVN